MLTSARHNSSPGDTAGWLIGLLTLALVVPAMSVLMPNLLFFSAHGVTQLQAAIGVVVVIAVIWAMFVVVIRLLRRWLSPRHYDVALLVITGVVAGFSAWNILARTLLAGYTWLALIPAVAIGIVFAALARRFTAGTPLAIAAIAAAVIPLALVGGESTAVADDSQPRPADAPSVLWIIADELQYPIVMNADGDVRDEFPALQQFQDEATTYTRAFTMSNYTDFAVPAMMNGLTDISGMSGEAITEMKASKGIASTLAANYAVIMESPLFKFACDGATCVNVSPVNDGPVQRVATMIADVWAVIGRTSLAPPMDAQFPSLQGKWRDFWDPGAVGGRDGVVINAPQVIKRIDDVAVERPGVPYLAFWHTMRTHGPWNVDRQGVQMYHSNTPVVDGSHSPGSQADQTFASDDLIHMARRMYVNSAVEFDRQLGELLAHLRTTPAYDNTMVIVTADHGVALTKEEDRRHGDDVVQRWSEIVHVPLLVKYPGETTAERVTEPRSTGQVAATVMDAIGMNAAGLQLAPPLGQAPTSIVFSDVGRPVMESEAFDPALTLVDPWVQDDLTPPDPAHPFALGIDLALLGGPVPAGYTTTTDVELMSLEGESDLEVLIVDSPPEQCTKAPALVTADGIVIGSVLWTKPQGDLVRGWSVVPRNDAYAFACSN